MPAPRASSATCCCKGRARRRTPCSPPPISGAPPVSATWMRNTRSPGFTWRASASSPTTKQAARWFAEAARNGHVGAQVEYGDHALQRTRRAEGRGRRPPAGSPARRTPTIPSRSSASPAFSRRAAASSENEAEAARWYLIAKDHGLDDDFMEDWMRAARRRKREGRARRRPTTGRGVERGACRPRWRPHSGAAAGGQSSRVAVYAAALPRRLRPRGDQALSCQCVPADAARRHRTDRQTGEQKGLEARAGHRQGQQCRPGAEGAEEEDAARGHLPRDEASRSLRKAIREEGAREGRRRPPRPQARPQARPARGPDPKQAPQRALDLFISSGVTVPRPIPALWLPRM